MSIILFPKILSYGLFGWMENGNDGKRWSFPLFYLVKKRVNRKEGEWIFYLTHQKPSSQIERKSG